MVLELRGCWFEVRGPAWRFTFQYKEYSTRRINFSKSGSRVQRIEGNGRWKITEYVIVVGINVIERGIYYQQYKRERRAIVNLERCTDVG